MGSRNARWIDHPRRYRGAPPARAASRIRADSCQGARRRRAGLIRLKPEEVLEALGRVFAEGLFELLLPLAERFTGAAFELGTRGPRDERS